MAKAAERAAKELGVNITVAPGLLELAPVSQSVEVPVYARGADIKLVRAYTVHISMEDVKEAVNVNVAIGGRISPIKVYVRTTVRNCVRYLYAQLYAGWRRRKTVYLGRDVNGVAGKIVSAAAGLGRTAGWSTAERSRRDFYESSAS